MKKLLILLASAVLLTGCNYMGGSQSQTTTPTEPSGTTETTPSTTATEPVTVQLKEQNKSGQTGTAMFKEVDGKTVVTLNLSGVASAVPQPAHIHVGKCPSPGAVKYPLTNVVNGMSETTLDMDMATLWKDAGNLAVNVHKSASDLKTYTACGDLM